MIKLILKPKEAFNLTDIYDFDSEESFKGTEYVVYDSALDEAPRSLPLTHLSKNQDLYCFEIYVKLNNIEYPIHESWISGVEVDGTAYEFDHSKPWLNSENIKTKTPHAFFNLASKSIIINDSCCSSCGASIDAPNEFNLCEDCRTELIKINNHSYKPTPVFIGNSPTNTYYGIELEYGFNSDREALKVTAKHSSQLYLKSDSSIGGGNFRAEVVSHPHTFEELMSDSSFLNTVSSASIEHSSNNGCHVHISRTAFKDKKHYSLFYFLLYSSQDLLEHIGGRALNSYCPYRPIGKVYTKDNTPITMDRYNVINEINTSTVEVRIFNSTNDTASLRGYVQFLDSLIEYTRSANKMITVKNYFKYVAKFKSKYPELHTSISNFKGTADNIITYREPKEKILQFAKLSINDLANVAEITMKDGTTYQMQQENPFFAITQNYTTAEFRGAKNGRSSSSTYTVPLKDISSIKVLR